MTTTVRIRERTHVLLRELARERGESLPDALDRLVEEDRRRRLLERTNEAYAALRADPEAWAEFQAEVAEWDATLADGLEDEPDEVLPDALVDGGEAVRQEER